jgi:DNA-binding GntR family transcriptional regulator
MTDPRYQQLAAAIRRQIADGTLPPGAALPSTTQLCQQYHIGHDTVRMAMRELLNEGLIVARRGDARYVAPGPPDPFTSTADGT